MKNKTKSLDNKSIEKTKKMKTKDTQKVKSKKELISEDTNTPKEKGYTDDGFKIVSFVPEDDSDVSDAFESCSEEEEEDEDATTLTPHHRKEDDTPSAKKLKKTEDGFKIVTDIPPDDSDVSDAFEDDDEDGVDMSASCHQQKNVAKPILQIMSDFGIDSRALTDRRDNTPKHPLVKLSKKQKKMRNTQANTVTQAAKVKKQNEVQIFDYARKRGVNKDRKPKPKEEDQEEEEQSLTKETLDEKQLKRVRYDVFRLGMSGFHKEKKEDTRVALAIKLGAKPPKKKAINYKKFQEMKKEEKKREVEERQTKLKLGLKVPKPFKKKDKPVVKAAASQIGRYKHGVQVISKRDISKISKS